MDQIFQDHLVDIRYEGKEKFILPSWRNCNTSEDFIRGIGNYKTVFEKIKPEKIIWDTRELNFAIPPALQQWVDEFLNVPATTSGQVPKLGLILGEEALIQSSVMDVFENGKAELSPRFFINEEAALQWVLRKEKQSGPSVSGLPLLSMKQDTDNGKTQISLLVDSNEAHEFLYTLNRMLRHRSFNKGLLQNILSLTAQEKNICSYILKGCNNRQIGDKLCISPLTVKTHRKNIFRKLKCHNVAGLIEYAIFL